MSQQVNIELKENYLLAVFSGTFELKSNKELMVDILMECINHKLTKLLFDIRGLKGNMSTYERYNLATYFTGLTRQHPETSKIQIAVVGNTPLIDPNRFGETVAKNHGLNIKVSTEMNEVLEWLGVDK